MIEPCLYFSINNFNETEIERELEWHTPLEIRISRHKAFSHFFQHINFNNDLVDVLMGREIGELFKISVVSPKRINFFNEQFSVQRYITKRMGLALGFADSIAPVDDEVLYFKMEGVTGLEVYNDAAIVRLPIPNQTRFLFYQNEMLGVLTDRDFNVTGFVTWNLTAREVQTLREYSEKLSIGESAHDKVEEKMEPIINKENQKILISKILELKNIEIARVLYYGLKKDLIDSTFCIDFAISLLEQTQSKDSLILELAGLLEHDVKSVEKLLLAKIKNPDDVFISQGEFFNKTWFYLVLATEACALNIID